MIQIKSSSFPSSFEATADRCCLSFKPQRATPHRPSDSIRPGLRDATFANRARKSLHSLACLLTNWLYNGRRRVERGRRKTAERAASGGVGKDFCLPSSKSL